MAVELRHLRCFLAIVDEGNITRAAQRLHMSQPALSRALAQLERTVAVRLIDRSTHHLSLTEAGSTFAVTAREALERVDEADHLDQRRRAAAALRAQLEQRHARRRRSCGRGRRGFRSGGFGFGAAIERIAGLASGQVDIALVRGPITDPSIRSTVIDNEQRLAVVPVDHRLAGMPASVAGRPDR